MDVLSSIFSPIEKEYCISFVSDIMQIICATNTFAEEPQKDRSRIDLWASCDFCQSLRLLLYASLDQRLESKFFLVYIIYF